MFCHGFVKIACQYSIVFTTKQSVVVLLFAPCRRGFGGKKCARARNKKRLFKFYNVLFISCQVHLWILIFTLAGVNRQNSSNSIKETFLHCSSLTIDRRHPWWSKQNSQGSQVFWKAVNSTSKFAYARIPKNETWPLEKNRDLIKFLELFFRNSSGRVVGKIGLLKSRQFDGFH